MINYQGRLFTFGCSFTQYIWPTWADILGREFNYYENWGRSGAGNQYIFYSLIECYQRNLIDSNDTVIIMWSSTNREDRYINNMWQTPGNLGNQSYYDSNFIKKYYDNKGSILRDFSLISATKHLLEQWGVNYKFLSMAPLSDNLNIDNSNDILDFFRSTMQDIGPSMFEIIYKNQWNSQITSFGKTANKAEQLILLTNHYNLVKGEDWPSLDDFINDNIIDKFRKEMHNFNLFVLRDYSIKTDSHPVPTSHLQYLQTVLPMATVSNNTAEWINNYQLFDKFESNRPKIRF